MNATLLEKLDEIEAEMKRIGYWHVSPPDLQAQCDQGKLRSHLDASTFELWLQALFLPNARRSIKTNALSSDSQVGLMAMRQYDYHSSVPEAHGLMKLLYEFDDLVKGDKR